MLMHFSLLSRQETAYLLVYMKTESWWIHSKPLETDKLLFSFSVSWIWQTRLRDFAMRQSITFKRIINLCTAMSDCCCGTSTERQSLLGSDEVHGSSHTAHWWCPFQFWVTVQCSGKGSCQNASAMLVGASSRQNCKSNKLLYFKNYSVQVCCYSNRK